MRRVAAARWILLGIILGVLELLVRGGWVNPLILSPPSAVAFALGKSLVRGELLLLFGLTLYETAVSFAIALTCGLTLGYLLWRHERLGEAVEPLLGAVFGSPLILLYPIFLVTFGRTPQAVIAMGILSGAIPVTLGMRDGLVGVSRTFLRVGRSLNMTDRQILWKIQLPAAAPTIFAGLRLGFTYTLVNVLGVEFLVEIGGLGAMVAATYARFQIPAMYAGIVAVVALTALFLAASHRLQRRIR